MHRYFSVCGLTWKESVCLYMNGEVARPNQDLLKRLKIGNALQRVREYADKKWGVKDSDSWKRLGCPPISTHHHTLWRGCMKGTSKLKMMTPGKVMRKNIVLVHLKKVYGKWKQELIEVLFFNIEIFYHYFFKFF